ncbi:venom carboxylesterase-6-like [Photinus pyralis]|uniref:venom carboxylesterase-6-like n=1 Tax=Photinus pyralis TaxID=7054 RepID=UPI001266EA07|nr:venom carboxylesterase-6-like [Photinus pyralis]
MEGIAIFIFVLFYLANASEEESVVVRTDLGIVKGHYRYSYDNRKFLAFEGIPYAKPPVGNLRFEPPQPAEPWSGTLEATTARGCAQHLQPGLANEEEDCLYLNVYVPILENRSTQHLAVMVHIHGGGFMVGDPSSAGPDFVMDRDVMYVSLSYRLGVFGFLSTGDGVVPGNNGMKDQVLALKWVNSNIGHFGGNTKSITLTGVSAGAASVHLHYFSPQSRGLFHRGISHSGTALAPWAIHNDPLRVTKKLAKLVGCSLTSTRVMVDCLKTKSAQTLCENTIPLYEYCGFPVTPFSPVIEKSSGSETAFLNEHPYTLLERGDVSDIPWFTSITADEGLIFSYFCNNMDSVITDWHKYMPYILNYCDTVAEQDRIKIAEKITSFYFAESTVTDSGVLKAIGDRLFQVPMEKSIQMQAQVTKSPIYLYIYDYEGDLLWNKVFNITYKGANHGADGLLMYDSFFLRHVVYKGAKLSANDEWMKSCLVDIVTNFAKDGVPKYEDNNFQPTNDQYSYTLVRHKDVTVKHEKDNNVIQFWDSLHCDSWNYINTVKDEL